MLCATNFHRTIIDPILVGFDLSTGMYGAVDAVVCILSEDGDDRSVLCCDEGGCIDKRESIEFVIVNTCYVDKTLVFVGYASVTAEYTPICSSINEGTTLTTLDVAIVDVIPCSSRSGTSCIGRHH